MLKFSLAIILSTASAMAQESVIFHSNCQVVIKSELFEKYKLADKGYSQPTFSMISPNDSKSYTTVVDNYTDLQESEKMVDKSYNLQSFDQLQEPAKSDMIKRYNFAIAWNRSSLQARLDSLAIPEMPEIKLFKADGTLIEMKKNVLSTPVGDLVSFEFAGSDTDLVSFQEVMPVQTAKAQIAKNDYWYDITYQNLAEPVVYQSKVFSFRSAALEVMKLDKKDAGSISLQIIAGKISLKSQVAKGNKLKDLREEINATKYALMQFIRVGSTLDPEAEGIAPNMDAIPRCVKN